MPSRTSSSLRTAVSRRRGAAVAAVEKGDSVDVVPGKAPKVVVTHGFVHDRPPRCLRVDETGIPLATTPLCRPVVRGGGVPESDGMTYFVEKGDPNVEASRARERDEHERRYNEENTEHGAHRKRAERRPPFPPQEERERRDHTRGDGEDGRRDEKMSVLCDKMTKVCVRVPALFPVEKNTLPVPCGEHGLIENVPRLEEDVRLGPHLHEEERGGIFPCVERLPHRGGDSLTVDLLPGGTEDTSLLHPRKNVLTKGVGEGVRPSCLGCVCRSFVEK